MTAQLADLKRELEEELKSILNYWMQHDIDDQYGGFLGRIDYYNHADKQAEKGSVLNSRILWAFSAAFNATKNFVYLQYARRAYHYFIDHFIDKQNGGVYWSVDFRGYPADKKKQVYAQSFAVYALSEFYIATGLPAARQEAIDLFMLIEKFSYDNARGGYIDAFTETWIEMQNMSLSEKDANEKKTMNTHLHVLEAYTNLYHIWPQEILKSKITNLLQNFIDYIIDDTGHLILFFDEHWNGKSSTVSYGHDIEAAWLLQEAAEVTGDAVMITHTKKLAVQLAAAATEGVDTDGGLWYEYEPIHLHLVKEKHWWPQAEAMVGFFNAWQVSGEDKYLQLSLNSWDFIKQYICDRKSGEWVWGIHADYAVMKEKNKVGIWKCPYHNSRACIEIIKRIGG